MSANNSGKSQEATASQLTPFRNELYNRGAGGGGGGDMPHPPTLAKLNGTNNLIFA